MRNRRYKYTGMVAVLLLVFTATASAAAVWVDDDLDPYLLPYERFGPTSRTTFLKAKVAAGIQVNTDQEKLLGRDVSAYLDNVVKRIVGELSGKKFEETQYGKAVAVDPKIFDCYEFSRR